MSNSDGDTQAPATFENVSWDAPTGSPPADTSGATGSTAPSPAAATSPPADTSQSDAHGDRESDGPVPFDRHKAILEAERTKHTDLEAKWQRVAWVEELVNQGLTPDQARSALTLSGYLDSNPAQFLEAFLQEASNNPSLAPQVRSIAARVLGQRSASPDDDPEPQPDYYVDGQDGNRTPFMSAPTLAKWRSWHERKLKAEMDARLGPIEQREQARTQAQAVDTLRSQVFAATKAELDDLRTQPHFSEHEAEIKSYLASQNYQPSLHQAYVHVLTTKVLPGISQRERDAAIAEMQKQAHAGSVNPKGGAPSTPAKVTRFDDPSLKWT